MVGKSNNVLVEYDYENIILIDPNKLVNEEGRAEERLVDHEDLVMYANLTCKLVPRTRLAIGADIQNSIREVTLAEINFMSQQTTDGKNFLNNLYTDEITGKNTLEGKGINQPKNVAVKKPTKDGGTSEIITQKTFSEGKEGSFNTGLLGITSINIKNSTSFVPSVTIEFEDVRGRALFERGDQSPYAAFFHLPYPIFYLTIKGYYGKAVKYPLQLHTFNARFNTMTGNYQVTCVFYSYKYGVLADLPIGTLYALPLMYKSEFDISTPTASLPNQPTQPNTNNTPSPQTNNTSQTKTFTTTKGSQKLAEVYADYKSKGLIPNSFPEINIQNLYHRLETLEDQIKAELGRQDMGALTDADTYDQDLKNYRREVSSAGFDSWFQKYIDPSNYLFDKNKIKLFFFKKSIQSKETDKKQALAELKEIIDRNNAKLARNKTFGTNGSFKGESTTIQNPITEKTLDYGILEVNNGIDYEYTYKQIKGGIPNPIQLTSFTQDTKDFLFDGVKVSSAIANFTKEVFFFDGQTPGTNIVTKKGFLNILADMSGKDGLQKFKEKIEKKLTEIIAQILESNTNGLGFRPTIRNIIAVVMASAEGFLRLLDDVHRDAWEVRNELARKNSILKNPGSSTPENKDFYNKLTLTDEYPVYPWPQFFSEKKDDKGNTRYEITYPADQNIIDNTLANDYRIWPEVEFEEEFINGLIERDTSPLSATNNSSNNPNRLSLNAAEFPIGFRPYSTRQISKFLFEMWERFIFSTYYNGIYEKNLTTVFAEMEEINVQQSGIENDPFLLNLLKNYISRASQVEPILRNVSNEGTGESISLYDRSIFATPYIRSVLTNSFVILGQEYFTQSITKPSVDLSQDSLNKLYQYLTGKTQNVSGLKTSLFTLGSFLTKPLMNLYPFAIDGWAEKNMQKVEDKDILRTSRVLTYNKENKLIGNFTGITQSITSVRPYTSLSIYLRDIPKTDLLASVPTINRQTLQDFYKNRYTDTNTVNGQMTTEGTVEYKNYQNQLISRQTTSMINTPMFVNSLQFGVDNYLTKKYTVNRPPYVEAAYLFLNSLPLATLKEKYITIDNNNQINDLDYLFACFKKNSAIHKVPYAWVLKYGSIWHRYKRYIETGKDFLEDVWKNFDYKNNWDPVNPNRKSWNIDSTTVFLDENVNNQIKIDLGFFPKTIDDFSYFFQSEQVFSGYTDQFIKDAFKDKKIQTISGSSLSDKYYIGINPTNTAQTLSLKTHTFLAKTQIPKKGYFVLPSFGSNMNQVQQECFSGGTIMTTPLLQNKAMYNGSVRTFLGVPHYGYFDIDRISIPRPDQYIKQIFSDKTRQTSFHLGDQNSYSSIEEIFAVFDKEALDQFESYFIKWCVPLSESTGELPIPDIQFSGGSALDANIRAQNNTLKNFQRLFRELMFIDEADLNITGSTSEQIRRLQEIQSRNIFIQMAKFVEYDVVIKYGNPTFMERRTFLSLMKASGSNRFPIEDPVQFGFYGDLNSGVVPTSGTINLSLSALKNIDQRTADAWKALELFVGFSKISNISYTNTGSTITDFFTDLNISFNEQNVKVLAPLIKIYATQKKISPSYNKQRFINDLTIYFNQLDNFRNGAYDAFIQNLQKKIKNVNPVRKIRAEGAPLQGNQTRVELWEMFKAINDKWIAGNNYTNRTLFEDVLFLDRASRDIGDKVFIDIYQLKSQLKDINKEGRVMGFVLDFVMNNNFVAMSIPAYVNFYNAQEVNANVTPKIEGSLEFANNLFGTHLTVDIRNSSPKLVCFYADKVSEHPEIENSEYRWGSDSFDLRRFSDNPLIENQIGKTDWGKSNKVVGFNVDVGIRNQNMFSNIILAQEPGKATAESLRILDLMANSASGKQTATQNVSLFNLYKSRSYTCSVQSMGNAMIQPTMYFNLRHVPMFNGPYMILSVDHSIQPGTFTTTFSGIRQSKFSLPLIEDFIQNIYKIYLSKFLNDVRKDIAKEETAKRNVYALNAKSISNSEEKQKTLDDCRPRLDANSKYQLTSKDELLTKKQFTNEEVKEMVSKIIDIRVRLIVFSAIYNNSYHNGFFAYGNNLLGFSLDNPIKGNLASLITNEYVCAKSGDDKIPLAIFKDVDSMVTFGREWFDKYADRLRGKINTLAPETQFIYNKLWPQTRTDDGNVRFLVDNTEQGRLERVRFEEANKMFLELFPTERGKIF